MRNSSNKDLEYYMGLSYPITLEQLPRSEGGGWYACIPMLGRYAFNGEGETVTDALNSLQSIQRHFFQKYLADGITIPEPTTEPLTLPQVADWLRKHNPAALEETSTEVIGEYFGVVVRCTESTIVFSTGEDYAHDDTLYCQVPLRNFKSIREIEEEFLEKYVGRTFPPQQSHTELLASGLQLVSQKDWAWEYARERGPVHWEATVLNNHKHSNIVHTLRYVDTTSNNDEAKDIFEKLCSLTKEIPQ